MFPTCGIYVRMMRLAMSSEVESNDWQAAEVEAAIKD